MRKKLKQTITTSLLAASLVFSLTACGGEQGAGTKEAAGKQETTAGDNTEEVSPESAVLTDETLLQDGKLSSNSWRDGILKINGKIFATTKTTLEQFTESGYTADEADMNYILYGYKTVHGHDGKHQEIKLEPKNYSKNTPLYCKHALISGYTVDYSVGDGMEGADAILPGNIKGGMTRDEIIAIVGTPEDNDNSNNLSYRYEENDLTVYSLSFDFDYNTHKLIKVSYDSSQESANVADDSDTIQGTLYPSTNTTLTGKATPSDVLKDAEIKIGSQVYTMPISVSDLTALGYGPDNDNELDLILNVSETYEDLITFTDKGGNIFYGSDIYNSTASPCPISNSFITQIDFDSKAENVSIAQGIKVGSTYDEVCKAFGKKEKGDVVTGVLQNQKVDDSYAVNYTYSAKRGEVSTVIFFDKSTDKVTDIRMSVKDLSQQDED